jgi:myb proto-oncogene protein
VTTVRFSQEEDAKLTEAVTEFGSKDWARVAVMVPGRTNVQCRLRWAETLDPMTNGATKYTEQNSHKGKLSEEEDAKLT